MTDERFRVILDRYRRYARGWAKSLADEDCCVWSTYAKLAECTGVQPQSVGPALRRMEELGLIADLSVHTAEGTRFAIQPSALEE